MKLSQDLSQIAEQLAKECKANKSIDLSAQLPREFYYNSLDLCVIDAVFSIGVKYESVINVVEKYEQHIAANHRNLSGKSRTTRESIDIFEGYGPIQSFAKDVLNQQRTSSRNGILKAEAVLEVLKTLGEHGIKDLECFKKIANTQQEALDKAILSIKGQGSGIMLKYLYMLVGNDNMCKPDRMLRRYVENISGRSMSDVELQEVMTSACEILKKDFPTLTVRILDNQIWIYQKNIKKLKQQTI